MQKRRILSLYFIFSMQYWWHHKTQHAPFGLSVALVLGFCGLLGFGLWHLLGQRQIGLPEIVLPEALNTASSPAAVHNTYVTEIKSLIARLETPNETMGTDLEKGLLSVRVPKEKLDAHLAAVLAWNRLDKNKLTAPELVTEIRPLLVELLK